MICQSCGYWKTSVTETVRYPDSIRRRRRCQKCGASFGTLESYLTAADEGQIMGEWSDVRKKLFSTSRQS